MNWVGVPLGHGLSVEGGWFGASLELEGRLRKLEPRSWWDSEWTLPQRSLADPPTMPGDQVRELISLTSLENYVLQWSKTEISDTVQS